MLLERGQVIGREPLDAVARRDVAEPGTPEGERIDQRLAQDDFRGRCERGFIPDSAMRPRQVQVVRRACAQVVVDLAAVDLGDLALRRDDRITIEPLKCS